MLPWLHMVIKNNSFLINCSLVYSNKNIMETHLNLNDDSFNNYQKLSETSETYYTRKPFFGIGKKSFLVFNRNKYLTVPTDTIAFFYIKYDATVIVTFDRNEYSVNYSLEQIQQLLPEHQFYRLNRQYLINFR